ncbi:MAG: chemotaxis protein CheW, partial [Thermoleophilia bacterium]
VRLPLTLAIIGALLVRAAEEVYAVPIEAIEEIVEVPATDVRNAGGRPCMVLRDSIVPMIWLRERLHLDGDRGDREQLDVVVVNTSAGRVGVVVDGLIGQQDIVTKQLPLYLGEVLGVAGATILGDGSVALIVDIGALGASACR